MEMTISNEVPDHVKKYNNDSLESYDPDMVRTSYLKLVQSQTNEFKEGRAKMGDYINDVTQQTYHEPEIVILKMTKIWKLFKDNELQKTSSNGLTWEDGTEDLPSSTMSHDERWRTLRCQFHIILKEEFNDTDTIMPCIIEFGGCSVKVGKNLYNFIFNLEKKKLGNIFSRTYVLGSKDHTSNNKLNKIMTFRLVNGYNSEKEMGIAGEYKKIIEKSMDKFMGNSLKTDSEIKNESMTYSKVENKNINEKEMADLD